jgi:hypothetical protein
MSISEVAKRDLERYYALLEAELSRLKFTEAEASLLCDACNGLWVDSPRSVPLLWAEVQDACDLSHLHLKWEVDPVALVAKLRAASPSQVWALIDAIEQFWKLTNLSTAEALHQVGLV